MWPDYVNWYQQSRNSRIGIEMYTLGHTAPRSSFSILLGQPATRLVNNLALANERTDRHAGNAIRRPEHNHAWVLKGHIYTI